ncbi:MAG: DUF4129 domain-containing protein [Planctomycetota bacterium]
MNEPKLRPTSLDYALAAIAPALIILMIGSLVAFLMTALYRGEFPVRLMWVLGLFTFASVLISRIAIEQSRSQALVYLGLLGGATLLVAPRYFVIEGPFSSLSLPILVVFLLLISYLADRITFDCTAVDVAGDAQGEGLLQSLGLLKKSRIAVKAGQTRRKHNPGVWVLYFALLALPVFGLGQLIIESRTGRSLAWFYMIVYLLSALLLLVMISLLSVRRYSRQRGLEMEMGLSMKWLLAGGAAVSVLMMVMAILPLPSLDSGFWEPPFKITNRDDLRAHRWGWGSETVGDGKGGQQQGGQQQGGQQQGGQQQGEQQQGEQQQGVQQQGEQQQGGQQPAAQQPTTQKQDQKSAERKPGELLQRGNPQDAAAPQPRQDQTKFKTPELPKIEWNPGASLRWLMLLVLVAIAIFFAIRNRRELAAWIHGFIAMVKGWFHPDAGPTAMETGEISEREEKTSIRFSDLPNPFSRHAGDPDGTIKALFDAACIWGHEHRVPRREDETPEEFVARLGRKYSPIAETLKRLGMAYSRLAYAQKHVQPGEVQALRTLWDWMVQHPSRAASPGTILK